MIVTVTEVKNLLQISNSTYDSFIKIMIPIVENVICDYCNKDFTDRNYVYFSSNTISFTGSTNEINFTGIGNKQLVENDTIRVYGSLRNDNPYTVQTVNDNSIVVNDVNRLIDEDEGEGVFIARIKYPTPLKMVAAKMIKYDISLSEKEVGVKSEKIDDYSITYDDKIMGYPSHIMTQLNDYRTLYKSTILSGGF
ncbi:MAG: hypothetical protein PVJ67_05050 [Candidatus Pacearchaeota archaeon]|jgi:hypothetical protein